MRYYLAGPMTNIPQFNIPAFDAAAKYLREEMQVGVISPVELDDPVVREWCLANETGTGLVPGGITWGEMLSRDLRVITDLAAGVFVLPGWNRSKGACLETFAACLCQKPVYSYEFSSPLDWHKVDEDILSEVWLDAAL